jgi:hypothetical protein
VYFRGQNCANSLYFSLLAGNSGGERLAPDCALRHTVLTAEKLSRLFARRRKVERILNHGYVLFGHSGLTKTPDDVSIHTPKSWD